jgi:hypothetical protein
MRLLKLHRLRHRPTDTTRRGGRVRRATVGTTVVAAAVAGTLGLVNVGVASATLTGSVSVPAQSPTAIAPGGIATYSPISVSRTNTGSPKTPAFAELTATGLPSGATFDDSGDGCVAVSGSTFTFTSAEITTSPSTPLGSDGFSVIATGYSDSNCTATSGGTATGNGTLVVSIWNANGGVLTCGTANNTTVPAGDTYVTATLLGGGGGGAGAGTTSSSQHNSFGGNGAPGGSVSVTYPVTAGTALYVNVGCGGGAGVGDASTASGGAGGPGYTLAGAGGAGSGNSTLGAAGGGGGGSTGLCVGTTSCTTPIAVVAGGGGGGAGCGYNGTAACTGASGADGGAGGSTNSATNAGNGGRNVNGGGSGTAGGTGHDGSASTGGSSGESSGSGFGGSGGGAGVQEGGTNPGGPGGGGGGGTGGTGATNNGGTPGGGGANNTVGGGGSTAISGSTTEGAPGSTTTLGNGGAGGTTTKGSTITSNEVNMGGGGGGAGWTGGGGGGPNYTVSTTSQFSAGGGGGGSSWAAATASPAFSPNTGGLVSSCGPGDSAYSTGLSLGLGGYGDGQATSGVAGTGDAGCPGNVTLTFHSPPATPTLTSGSLTVTAGSAISAAITSSGATSYTESGSLPSGVNFSSSSGALTGTPTVAGTYPFTVSATGQYGTSSAGNFTLTVNAAGASTLAFVQQPSDTFTGTAISPSVTIQVQDAYGNPISDNGLSVTVTPSANTITSGGTASTNSSGLATFSAITINTAAINLTLTASASGLSTSSPSSSFNVTVLVNNGDTFTDTASDGTGSGVKSVTYYYCAGLSGSCTSSSGTQIGSSATSSPYTAAWNSQPADGDYQVVAVGTDNVTNVSAASSPIPVTVDNTAPAVSVNFPVNGTTYTSSTWNTITGTASDATSDIVSAAVAVENTTTGKWWGGTSFNQSSADYLAASGTTSWSYVLATTNLTPGDSYNVVAQATDGVGNVGTSSTVSVKMAPLTILSLKVTSTSNNEVEFTGNGASGSTTAVTVTVCKVNAFPCTGGNTATTAVTGSSPANPWTTGNTALGALTSGVQYYAEATQGSATSAVFPFVYEDTQPSPTNVVLADGSGTTGKADSGDTATVTFSEALDASTICSSWVNDGTAQSISDATIQISNATDSLMTVTATSSCSTNGNFGIVATEADYVNTGTLSFTNSTIGWDPTTDTLTFTLGTLSGGTSNTLVTTHAARYTADSSMKDLSGISVSTTQIASPTSTRF